MKWLATLGTVLCIAPLGSAALADEIKVLTAGAFKPVIAALTAGFERDSGHVLTVVNDTAGALEKRILAGERFDLVVLPPAGLERLVKAERVAAASSTRLARVAIGVAVKRGEPSPDISTVAAFRQTLLAAQKVAMIDPAAGGSSGIYLTQLFQQWGIAPQITAKAVLVPGGLVAEKLVSGEADLALHQISEILAVPGARLVGPIPSEIQNYTVYAGGIASSSKAATGARALLDLLGSELARGVLRDKGMEAP